MPGGRDIAQCVTELRVMGDIVKEIQDGRGPRNAFEIPTKCRTGTDDLDTSPDDETLGVSTPSSQSEEIGICKSGE